jgi:glycosyltransferase involved in cell wall biosynthesis
MNVLFLMLAFPDMDKSFNMYTAIVEEFCKNGHTIFVVAPAINGAVTAVRKENGIDVLRVKTLPVKNIPNYLKGIANIFLPYQFKKALKKVYPDVHFDLIISPTPPVTLVDLVSGLKKKQTSSFYLILRDIFPQNAVDLGFMSKKSFIYRYFRKKEKKLYKSADFIGCMSSANVQYILRHNQVDPGKLHVLENYQKLYRNYGELNENIKKRFSVEGKFIVVFGGNMGKPQQIENVLTLAKSCEAHKDVIFLLLGEGLQKKTIENLIQINNLTNVRLLDTVPKQTYQALLSVCDVGLISLHKDFTIPNIPSKTLDYFNVGIPVLASIDKATDYGMLLDDTRAGLWSFAGDHQMFKTNFDRLYSDVALRKEMGANGRKYFEAKLTPDIAYSVILKNIKRHVLETKGN